MSVPQAQRLGLTGCFPVRPADLQYHRERPSGRLAGATHEQLPPWNGA
ncbi:hypothetical protein ACFQ7B_38020 [Streptomyces erythrochromogenes]